MRTLFLPNLSVHFSLTTLVLLSCTAWSSTERGSLSVQSTFKSYRLFFSGNKPLSSFCLLSSHEMTRYLYVDEYAYCIGVSLLPYRWRDTSGVDYSWSSNPCDPSKVTLSPDLQLRRTTQRFSTLPSPVWSSFEHPLFFFYCSVSFLRIRVEAVAMMVYVACSMLGQY